MAIFNQRGSVLLFVIAGIAMIASIAMGMFYMTSTASLGQAGGSGMNRAYYLALAGKDYATANWNSRTSWNNIEFSLSNTETFQVSYLNEKITSTGIVNKDTPFEAKKIIIAQSPSPVRKHFLDTFENLTNWATGAGAGEVGSHGISADKALDVISAPVDAFGSGSGQWSFLQLNTVLAKVDLNTSWLDAGRCLSYDLQVKISNIRRYYMAGLNFKVAGSGNSSEFYGISFLRARRVWDGGTSTFIDGAPPNDNIPNELKPSAIYDPAYGSLYVVSSYQYSHPAIVLWKRYLDSSTGLYSFTWLAYKLLTSDDYVVYDNNPPDKNYLLSPWSNLQVRLIEAYPLGFTTVGQTPSVTTPFLHGSVVSQTNGASGRISGSAIVTSGSWESGNAAGILTLTNKSETIFVSGDLLVNGSIRATTPGALGPKTNFIRVYYGDVNSHGTSNNFPTDNDRGSSPRIVTGSSIIHWPVDNMSDWKEYYDYMTLVKWGGINPDIVTNPPVKLTELIKVTDVPTFAPLDTIIQDSSLLTQVSGTINYSGIALHATGNNATYTYFDDFAIQY